MLSAFKKYLLIFSLNTLMLGTIHGQNIYQTKDVFSEKSQDLINAVILQNEQRIVNLGKDEKYLESKFNSITEEIVWLIKNEKLIDDDSIQMLLKQIVDKIVAHNVVSAPERILVLKSAEVNAYNLGNGILVVCNGLLAKFDNEEQLAFVLAHEIAHQELSHFKRKITQNLNAAENYQASREIKNLEKGKVSLEGIRKIRNWNYDKKSFSRKMEFEADSLAFVLFTNSYKNCQNVVRALHKLDSASIFSPELGGEIFAPLSFEQYPFKGNWIKKAKVEYIDMASFDAYNIDSSLTHPLIEQRIKRLDTFTKKSLRVGTNLAVNANYRKIKLGANYENVECAFVNDRLEHALYLALRMIHDNPNNSYLVEMVAKVLLHTAELKSKSEFNISALDISDYNQEQVFVSNFIINLRGSEAAELAYHFMNQKGNFDKNNEEHYYLLYRICKHTDRFKIREVVKYRYLDMFKDGKYVNKMI